MNMLGGPYVDKSSGEQEKQNYVPVLAMGVVFGVVWVFSWVMTLGGRAWRAGTPGKALQLIFRPFGPTSLSLLRWWDVPGSVCMIVMEAFTLSYFSLPSEPPGSEECDAFLPAPGSLGPKQGGCRFPLNVSVPDLGTLQTAARGSVGAQWDGVDRFWAVFGLVCFSVAWFLGWATRRSGWRSACASLRGEPRHASRWYACPLRFALLSRLWGLVLVGLLVPYSCSYVETRSGRGAYVMTERATEECWVGVGMQPPMLLCSLLALALIWPLCASRALARRPAWNRGRDADVTGSTREEALLAGTVRGGGLEDAEDSEDEDGQDDGWLMGMPSRAESSRSINSEASGAALLWTGRERAATDRPAPKRENVFRLLCRPLDAEAPAFRSALFLFTAGLAAMAALLPTKTEHLAATAAGVDAILLLWVSVGHPTRLRALTCVRTAALLFAMLSALLGLYLRSAVSEASQYDGHGTAREQAGEKAVAETNEDAGLLTEWGTFCILLLALLGTAAHLAWREFPMLLAIQRETAKMRHPRNRLTSFASSVAPPALTFAQASEYHDDTHDTSEQNIDWTSAEERTRFGPALVRADTEARYAVAALCVCPWEVASRRCGCKDTLANRVNKAHRVLLRAIHLDDTGFLVKPMPSDSSALSDSGDGHYLAPTTTRPFQRHSPKYSPASTAKKNSTNQPPSLQLASSLSSDGRGGGLILDPAIRHHNRHQDDDDDDDDDE